MPDAITQLGLFDNPDPRPLPLIVADKWQFPLQHYEPSEAVPEYRFSANDWLRGLTQSSNTSRLWNDLQEANGLYGSTVKLPYLATNGRTYQRDFISDKDLYKVTQDLRELSSRKVLKGALDEIRNYLASAGAFADFARRDPEGAATALLSAASRQRHRKAELMDRAGLGNRPEAQKFKDRAESMDKFNSLMAAIQEICDNPNYGQIVNTEYRALFGKIASELKAILGTSSIRDGLPPRQLHALTYAESSLESLLSNVDRMTNEQVLMTINTIFRPIGEHLQMVSALMGVHSITGQPLLEKHHA